MLWTLASALHWAFESLCLAVVLAFFLLVLTPRWHAPVRGYLRPAAVERVESGLAVCVAAQRWQRPWLTSLLTKSSHSVSVTFYASFLPILFWLGLPELGRDLVILMALALYVGNAIKDLVCSPRPMGLPYGRQKLRFLGESDEEIELNAKEYGLPSSHTLNTLCLNYFIVWYCHDRGLISPGTAAALYCAVVLWVCLIAFSRLYLGLHTPVDILAGALAGMATLVVFLQVEGFIGPWLQSGPRAVLHAALASLLLLRLHPRPLAHTPSFEFSTSFMGAMFGVVVGAAWISPRSHQPAIQLAQLWSAGASSTLGGSRLLWALRRFGLGFAVVAILKEASRAVLLQALPFAYRFFPLSIRRLWQPPMHDLSAPVAAPPAEAPAAPPAAAAAAAAAAASGAGMQQRSTVRTRAAAAAAAAATEAAGEQHAAKLAAAGTVAPAAKIDPRLAALPHNAKGQPWDVDVTARFFAYASLGVAVAGVSPRLFGKLGW